MLGGVLIFWGGVGSIGGGAATMEEMEEEEEGKTGGAEEGDGGEVGFGVRTPPQHRCQGGGMKG